MPYPPTGLMKTANCGGAEEVLEFVLPPTQVGWIAVNRPGMAVMGSGCNPMLQPCAADRTPVERSTWGGIKRTFGRP